MYIKNVLCSGTVNTPLFSGDLLGTSVIFCCQNLCQATSKLLWISRNSLPACLVFYTKCANKLRLTWNFPVPLKKLTKKKHPINQRGTELTRMIDNINVSTLPYLLACSGQSRVTNTHYHIAPSALSPRRPRAAGPPDWLLRQRLRGCELWLSGLMDSVAPQREALGHVRALPGTDAVVCNGRSMGAGALTKLII